MPVDSLGAARVSQQKLQLRSHNDASGILVIKHLLNAHLIVEHLKRLLPKIVINYKKPPVALVEGIGAALQHQLVQAPGLVAGVSQMIASQGIDFPN